MTIRYLAVGCALLIAGCGDSSSGAMGSSNPAGLSVETQEQTLLLKVAPGAHYHYQTCDLFQGIDKLVDGKWTPLTDDLPGTYYQDSSSDGYMLDGMFVAPSASAGCDLVQCEALPDGQDVGVAIEYTAHGTTAPPDDYVYRDPFVRPDTINVYESHSLHATRVRTHVTVFSDANCKAKKDLTFDVEMP